MIQIIHKMISLKKIVFMIWKKNKMTDHNKEINIKI
jgi:hypothetical protein